VHLQGDPLTVVVWASYRGAPPREDRAAALAAAEQVLQP